MSDEDKTREELISELAGLRQRVAELEGEAIGEDSVLPGLNAARLLPLILEQFAPDIVYLLNPRGRIIFISNAVRNLCYSPRELIDKPFDILVCPEDRQTAFQGYRERRTGDRATEGMAVRLVAKDGGTREHDIRWERVSIFARGLWDVGDSEIGEVDKRFLGTLGIARDVSGKRPPE